MIVDLGGNVFFCSAVYNYSDSYTSQQIEFIELKTTQAIDVVCYCVL